MVLVPISLRVLISGQQLCSFLWSNSDSFPLATSGFLSSGLATGGGFCWAASRLLKTTPQKEGRSATKPKTRHDQLKCAGQGPHSRPFQTPSVPVFSM